jgi:hypothetical protein
MATYQTVAARDLDAMAASELECRPLGSTRYHVSGRAGGVTDEKFELEDATGRVTVRLFRGRGGPAELLATPAADDQLDVYGRAFGCPGRSVVVVADAVVARR